MEAWSVRPEALEILKRTANGKRKAHKIVAKRRLPGRHTVDGKDSKQKKDSQKM